jgi:flagellar biosynthesis protein FliR
MQIQVESSTLIALLLVSTRIFAWAMIAPPLASAGLPTTVKTALSVGLALVIVPSARANIPSVDTASILTALVIQVAIGAGLGFLTRLVFSAIETAGGLLDVFGGFSLAAAYNPLTTTMTSIFGSFYALLCTTLIFATNIHLVIFEGFLRTFSAIPLNASMSFNKLDTTITSAVGDMFVAALQIAGPLIVVLFLADVALGLLSRIAPQLNAFSLSFPLKTLLTLSLVGSGFLLMPQTVVNLGTHVTELVGVVA